MLSYIAGLANMESNVFNASYAYKNVSLNSRIVGRAAFAGNHQWIIREAHFDCGPFSEVWLQVLICDRFQLMTSTSLMYFKFKL